MGLLQQLTRAYLINRLARGGRARRSSAFARGPRAYSRRSRARGGFVGPFPYYSTRTRGGSRVAVSGCCLPLPLAIVAAVAAGVRLLIRR
jgi:hypothetical protein